MANKIPTESDYLANSHFNKNQQHKYSFSRSRRFSMRRPEYMAPYAGAPSSSTKVLSTAARQRLASVTAPSSPSRRSPTRTPRPSSTMSPA